MARATCAATVAAALLILGCNNDDRSRSASNGSSDQSPAGTSSANSDPQGIDRAAGVTANSTDQLVTLTGCLKGGETTGSASNSAGARPPVTERTTRNDANEPIASSGASSGRRFMLIQGKPASPSDAAGVGANGAGGSGGPLISGVADYWLEGNVTELGQHLNHQVRVVARLNPRYTAADSGTPAATTGSDRGQATSGTSGSGVGATNSRREPDGTAQISGARNLPRGEGGVTPVPARLLVVESVQTVADSCALQ